jgi:hypothetical protein
MKSLMSLWRELADETASWCGTSASRDYQTVAVRTEKEGESFLTITLPQYCKDFERSLELGSIASTAFTGFSKHRGLPRFLGGFLKQIFSPDGSLLDNPSVDCIRAIRQLTLVFGKIERQCTQARISRAMQRYVQIEAELGSMDTNSFEEFLPLFRKASTLLWADVFSSVENNLTEMHTVVQRWVNSEESHNSHDESQHWMNKAEKDVFLGILSYLPAKGVKKPFTNVREREIVIDPLDRYHLVPKHGPGATADGLRGNAKFHLPVWPQRLERVFPYGEYAIPNWRYNDQLDRVRFLEPGKETPVKVVAVPKTLKTPRVIAEEPAAMQYMQQALAQQLIRNIEDVEPRRTAVRAGAVELCNLGRHFVGFAEQEPNRLLACEGSINCDLATLDLSEASDRVLNQHVELLFARFPRLSEAIQATRSLKADVPDHGIIPLVKFASMGSALCFPVEAMVFTTIVFAAIAYERREPLTRNLILGLRGKVRVYGDDIVVPVEYVHQVIRFLQAFGLVVNEDKSFWNGKFRESCGGDFYAGEWVTPVRLRKELPRSLADVEEVVGLVAFRNLLYWNGFWRTAGSLDARLRDLLKGHWSIVESTAAGLGRESVLPYQAERIHPKSHVPLVQGAIVKSRTPKSKASGMGALLKFGLKRSLIPSQDARHLDRQGRPESVRIKLRGIRPY